MASVDNSEFVVYGDLSSICRLIGGWVKLKVRTPQGSPFTYKGFHASLDHPKESPRSSIQRIRIEGLRVRLDPDVQTVVNLQIPFGELELTEMGGDAWKVRPIHGLDADPSILGGRNLNVAGEVRPD